MSCSVSYLFIDLCIHDCRLVKEFVATNDVRQIKRLTSVLAEEFAVSHNNHSRKGGLIGLAATAIALGKVQIFGKLAYFDYCWLVITGSISNKLLINYM